MLSRLISKRNSFAILALTAFGAPPKMAMATDQRGITWPAANTPQPAPQDHVETTLLVVREACFKKGALTEELRQFANEQRWTTVSETELKKNNTQFTLMTGGWTFVKNSTAFAVMQSAFRAPHAGYVCSVTTTLAMSSDHIRLKARFSHLFGTEIKEESDTSTRHTDRYWLDTDRDDPVKTTLTYQRDTGTITVRMIHGRAAATQS